MLFTGPEDFESAPKSDVEFAMLAIAQASALWDRKASSTVSKEYLEMPKPVDSDSWLRIQALAQRGARYM